MDVQDGFIVGIFNYCDKWCERCALTSRCRVFADVARHDAARDDGFKKLLETPPHPQDVKEPPPWFEELLEEVNKAMEEAEASPQPKTTEAFETRLPEPYAAISRRAKEYAFRVYDLWRDSKGYDARPAPEPVQVILHFATLIASKSFRALSGLLEFDGDREFPPDHEGSAKVALLGIDRSIASWRELGGTNMTGDALVGEMIRELEWVRLEIEAAIPLARAFVRPGFDEPEEFERLEAVDLS